MTKAQQAQLVEQNTQKFSEQQVTKLLATGQLVMGAQMISQVGPAIAQTATQAEQGNQKLWNASESLFEKTSDLKDQSAQSARAQAKEVADIWRSMDETKAQTGAAIAGNVRVG